MSNKLFFSAWTVFLLAMLCVQSYAEPAESARPFTKELTDDDSKPGDPDDLALLIQKGKQAFNDGNYAAAKETFLRVQTLMNQQGTVRPAIYYDLGSICYKLEQYQQSRDYFLRLVDDSNYSALAYYNIALIENQSGNRQAAIDAFNSSHAATDNEQLLALIDKQLRTLQPETLASKHELKEKNWHAVIYARPGYDSNIRFTPLEVASNESGNFVQYIGAFDVTLLGEGTGRYSPALLLTSNAFLWNYFSTDFNDYSLFDVGLRFAFPAGLWRNRIEFNLKESTYGHEDYQRTKSTTLRTRRKFANNDELFLRYRYEDIESLRDIYDYLTGTRQRFRVGYQFTWPQDTVQLWYEFETNDRKNTVNRNYSPTRNGVRLRYETEIDDSNRIYGEYQFRYSKYDPTPVQDRKDDRSTFVLAFINDIAKDWQAEVRWRFYSNRSTDTIYSYDRHIVYFSIRKVF